MLSIGLELYASQKDQVHMLYNPIQYSTLTGLPMDLKYAMLLMEFETSAEMVGFPRNRILA